MWTPPADSGEGRSAEKETLRHLGGKRISIRIYSNDIRFAGQVKNNSNVSPGINWKKSEPGDASGGPGRWRKEKAAETPGCFVFLHNEKSGPGGAGTALNSRPAEARQIPGTAAKRELFRKSKSKIHVKSWQRICCFAAETVKNFYKIIPFIPKRAFRPVDGLCMEAGKGICS